LIYGFFLTWLGTLSTFIVMGELSSMVPTAGGQYHWVSILAPDSIKRFASYVTGKKHISPRALFQSSPDKVGLRLQAGLLLLRLLHFLSAL
jgi:hypothetical protein